MSMKKLLLFVSACLIGGMTVQAQCTPDPQYTSAGIYPDSATNFAPACVNEPYTQLITNVVPADTTVELLPGFPVTLPIEKIDVISVTGLPPGMTFTCNPTSCSYPGGTTGCAIIEGTCATAGTYNLTIELTAFVTGVGSQNFTLDYYKIVVNPAPCSSANVLTLDGTQAISLYPNPSADKFTVRNLNAVDIQSVDIINLEGKIVQSVVWSGAEEMEITSTSLTNGMYYVNINHAKGTEVIKLIKE
jgi:hypothetical protein